MLGIDTNLNNNYGEGDLEDRSPKSEPGPMTRAQAAQTVLHSELKQLAKYYISSLQTVDITIYLLFRVPVHFGPTEFVTSPKLSKEGAETEEMRLDGTMADEKEEANNETYDFSDDEAICDEAPPLQPPPWASEAISMNSTARGEQFRSHRATKSNEARINV